MHLNPFLDLSVKVHSWPWKNPHICYWLSCILNSRLKCILINRAEKKKNTTKQRKLAFEINCLYGKVSSASNLPKFKVLRELYQWQRRWKTVSVGVCGKVIHICFSHQAVFDLVFGVGDANDSGGFAFALWTLCRSKQPAEKQCLKQNPKLFVNRNKLETWMNKKANEGPLYKLIKTKKL